MKKLPRVSKRGYILAGDKAQSLLFHGYTGSPYDLRPVANFLHEHDFLVSVPLLKGHGKNPSDLFAVSADDWIAQAKACLHSFNTRLPVVVGGLSMGALLGILLAAEHKHIKALLLFSPALELGFLANTLIASANLGLISKERSIKKFGGSDIFDKEAREKTPAYKELPIAGLLEFEKLRKLALENLARVTCPIFMAFGKFDGTIDITASHQVILEATSVPLFSNFYTDSKHVITLDRDREQIMQDMWEFLTREMPSWC